MLFRLKEGKLKQSSWTCPQCVHFSSVTLFSIHSITIGYPPGVRPDAGWEEQSRELAGWGSSFMEFRVKGDG